METSKKYHLSEEENEEIFQEIKSDIFCECQTVEFPVAIIFGGQPGAGKTKAIELSQFELKVRGGAALIAGDEFRSYHTQHDLLMKLDDNTASVLFTQYDAGRWVEKAITHAKNIRCNIIIEGTMRLPETVVRTTQELRETGYIIEARVLAVNKKLSWQGVLQRYENQRLDRSFARMTPPKIHEAAYSGVLESVDKIEKEKLADKVVIYKRGGEIIYENELHRGEWKYEPKARATVENERNRQWTENEKLEYAYNFDKLLELIKLPERKASNEEVNVIQSLRDEAYLILKNKKKSFHRNEIKM